MKVDSPIILALDSTDVDRCSHLIRQTQDSVAIYKLGLEFYLMHGATGIYALRREFPGLRIFLDLKLHDIPNTVAAAAKSVSHLEAEILTVHASGGRAMIEGAVAALPNTIIAGVTVLTSLTEADLAPFGNQALESTVAELAIAATAAGARAIITSPIEVSRLRSILPSEVKLITPGIRLASQNSDDQNRIATPKSAIAAGADYLVIGRPITGATDPRLAAMEIYRSIG